MAPIKLLYLITTLGRGGSERNLVNYCERVDRSRYAPEVWYLHDTEHDYRSRLDAAGVPTRCLRAPSRPTPWSLLRIAREIARSNAQLVHIFLPTVGYYAALAKGIFHSGCPMVYSCGGVQILLPFQRQMLRYGVGRYCYPILCNSQTVKCFLTDLGIDEQRLRIVPNGHCFSVYERALDRAAIRRELGVGPDELLLISVGRLIDTKRHVDLIQALAQLDVAHRSACKLLLVGSGPMAQELQRAAAEHGLADCVIFAGHRDDGIDLLRASDLFLFPSESEGLPNAIIEAALARVPIVASAIPAVTEIVRDGESAVLVPTRNPRALADAIEQFRANPAEFRKRAENAWQAARAQFGMDQVMDKLYAAYSDAMVGYAKRRQAQPQ